MTPSDSSRDSSESAHSLASGVFTNANIQVIGTCGSSYITDVIRVERNGTRNAVKILTPSATRDPDLVGRFLTNARYNQTLNEFTGMRITEIVETGPRPYYVMERVSESSLLEVIRMHAPIDPSWLCRLMLPVARSLDTIHQRNILHANIKPSNILVVVENGEEKFLLVDYLDPTLAATSATLTGAGVYAAPEFRAGLPVSNRSDIFSLGAVLYEALSARVPIGAYRNANGTFHPWRAGDRPQELALINPEISRSLSDMIMNSISPQAISRPASASMLVEESLRALEQPRSRVRVAQENYHLQPKSPTSPDNSDELDDDIEVEHTPVPMLLIAIGVFLCILLLFGAYKVVGNFFSGSPNNVETSTTKKSTSSSTPETAVSDFTSEELTLLRHLPTDQQNCRADRSTGEARRWPIATAILDCTAPSVKSLSYALFSSARDVDDTYKAQASLLAGQIGAAGGTVGLTQAGSTPCAANPNESGEWGDQKSTGHGGKYTCVSTPSPRIVWTERTTHILGDASLTTGSTTDLINWWLTKSGPK